MAPTLIEYAADGTPLNLPDADVLLLYGVGNGGLDAEGPILGQWDDVMTCWSDQRYGEIEWHPVYYAVPPANPCKSVSAPTVGNDVV